jgi:uracil-DNA glycosylase
MTSAQPDPAGRAPFVPPGTGWPGDPATPDTPVAHGPGDVVELAASASGLDELAARESVCRACPRLVEWRERVAVERRRAYENEQYWGRPIPGWGDDEPRILLVGLAPAAHGGNRTGRIFTGDRSGEWLFASLHRVGLSAHPESVHAADEQRLHGMRVGAVVRCAPPDNKPLPAERDACLPWLAREVEVVAPIIRCVVVLGGYAWQGVWPALKQAGYEVPRPRPAFGHGTEVELTGRDGKKLIMLGSYHPSQQNTFTGRVTTAMLDAVFTRAREIAGLPAPG